MNYLISTLLALLIIFIANHLIQKRRRQKNLRKWLYGRTILVVGASSGIGEQIAILCSQFNCGLILASRRIERLQTLAGRCSSIGAKSVHCFQCDIKDIASIQELFSNISKITKEIGLVCICSGVGMDFSFEETTQESCSAIYGTNLFGPLWIAQKSIPFLKPQKQSLNQNNNRILIISSMSAWIPRPRRAIYASSKSAVSTLFENLRTEISCFDIGITIAFPGFVQTELAMGISRLNSNGLPISTLSQQQNSKPSTRHGIPVLSAEKCAEKLLIAVSNGDRTVITPWFYSLLWSLHRLFPAFFESFVQVKKQTK